ncbi:hypothetical protein MWU38_11600 [Qipengyuania sp. S6317L1]|uniref:hypothetical protein n=1 Tax=Qipengyuania sp. S6317L1 TaxID=2926410 RepID=UPI001FF2BCAD|nr:hypothetical protein [Qipengyuania sp. S6317L1]MCK0100029.1 hypothetical protein [Qipengyuania sp. S6317L1]
MSQAFATGPGFEIFNLQSGDARGTVLSPDETTLYVSSGVGFFVQYDVATRTLLQFDNLNINFSALTISDDGNTIYGIGVPTGTAASPLIYEIDVSNGSGSNLVPIPLPNSSGLNPSDIEYVSGDKLLISGPPSHVYDLATQTAVQSFDPGFNTNSVIYEDDGIALIADIDISDAQIQIYNEAQGQVVGTISPGTGIQPRNFNNGVMAVSAEAGLIAVRVGFEGIKVYDLAGNIVFAERFFGVYEDGMAFSSDGAFLLGYNSNTLSVIDTSNWTVRRVFDMSGSGLSGGSAGGSNGDSVRITSDDQTIIITNEETGYINIISLSEPIGSDPGVIGSEGDDNLQAILGQDVDGLGGNDRLEIDLRSATQGVIADFRGLATGAVTVEGATIVNIENIQIIEGSEFADFLAPYQDFPIGNGIINGYGGDDEIIISMSIGGGGPQVSGGEGDDLIDARGTFNGGDYFGGNGNDTIYTGQSFRAFAFGGEGDDIIETYGSADGGAGNDVITLFEPGDVSGTTMSATGGDGDDIISVDLSDRFGDPPDASLSGGAGADFLTGGNGNDFLASDGTLSESVDNGVEVDTLIGGAGSDRLIAGIGDNVDGGDGFDLVSLSFGGAQSGITLNTDDLLAGSSVIFGGGTIQNVETIERIIGTEFADNITVGPGSAPPSSRTQVEGRGGNDVFNNNGGAATFVGEQGDDRYLVTDNAGFGSFFGGDGIDTIDLSATTTGLTVALSDNPQSTFGSSDVTEQLSDVENIEGGSGNDTLTGSVVANVINGNGGNDIIDGGFGDNTLNGGAGVDELQFLFANAPATFDLRVTTAQQVGTGIVTASGFENVTGSQSGDTLTGDSGANVIRGMGGNDRIDGAGGDDELDGGAGTDTLRFGSAAQGVSINLALTTAQDTGVGLITVSSFENLEGSAFDDTLTGTSGNNVITGGNGDDTIDGGAGFDRAVFSGDFAQFAVLESQNGIYSIAGQGVDSVTQVEVLRFDDINVLLDLGTGLAIDPGNDDPNTFMVNIRDFDGNDIGAGQHWVRIGVADANLDGSDDVIFVNRVNGRFAEVGVNANGLVQFDNHGQGGDTRVVGIYIDPLVEAGTVEQGGPFDSQQRFQNDLFIGNIARVLGSQDYDGDGFAEIYFALTDGTAYLRALMHADGNIQYANYQSQEQVTEYLNSQGFGEETYGDWFPPPAPPPVAMNDIAAASAMDAGELLYARQDMIQPEFFG